MKLSARVRANSKRILQVFLVLFIAVQLSSCFLLLLDEDEFWDVVLDFLSIPNTPFLKHAQEIGSRLRPFGTESTPANPANLQVAPFFGNLSVVTLSPTAPLHDNFILSRQADCSISFLEAAIAVNANQTALTITPDAPVPHYEKTIHNNAFLTTTPDVFPHGCTDVMNGNSSRVLVTLGLEKNGGELVATLGNGGIVTSAVKADGTFTKPVILPTTNPPLSVIGADLNKDGNPDVVAVTSSGLQSTVVVFLGNADGSFQPGVSLALPGEAAQVAVIDDLNGDGKLDILASSSSPSPFAFTVFFGNGDGTFKPGQNVTPAGVALGFNTTFITADLRGISKKDIVAANGQVFLGAGDGVTYTLVPTAAFTPSNTGTSQYAPSIVAADFNNDGKLDLATNDGVTIRLFKGNGDGTFVAGPAYATIPDFGFMIATDLDGDGNIDLWSGFGGNGIYAGSDTNLAYALMGNGDGTFQGARSLPISFTGGNFANLDNGAVPALIGPDPSNPGTLSFITELAQANGTFKSGPTLVPPNDGADSWALGDFNGDGKADLIFLNINPNTPGFYVALGNGDGSFQTPVFTAAPALAGAGNIDINEVLSGIQIADFNHDGKLDIAYSFSDQGSVSQLFLQGFAVQLGKGDGTFQAPVITTTFSSLTAPQVFFSNMLCTVADVNGDNFPDVFMVVPTGIVNGELEEQTELFVGKGDGSFKTASIPTLTPNIRPLVTNGTVASPFVIADLNGDGKVDLIAGGSSADGTTPELAIALGNGDGTFQAPMILTLEGFGFVNGVGLADFDHDGKLDLFVGGTTEAFGGFFPGNGNGTFQTVATPGAATVTPPLTLALQAAGSTIATDLNGDGKPDLIVGPVVLLNENGSIAPVLPSTTTTVTSSLNPATVGANVTFTATVSSATAGAITGNVIFFDGALQIGGQVTLGADGSATETTAGLTAGTHSITAQYSGDPNFAGSTSPILTETINAAAQAATSITIVSTLNPSILGGTVGFDATVTSATAGTITGTVTFFDGANSLGSAPLQAGGVTDLFTSTFVLGANTITAKYSGDANFAASTSPPITQTVNAPPLVGSTTTLTGPATAAIGASVTFMASVTPASGTKVPTGTVTFANGATTLGTGTLNGSGSTSFSTTTLPAGTNSITAKYSGDANFSTSTSAPLSISITGGGTFTLSVAPSSVTVTDTQPGLAAVTVTPANGFNQPVQFSCTGAPEGVDCEFEPNSVTPNGGPVTTMLSVTEGEQPAARRRKAGVWNGPAGLGGSSWFASDPIFAAQSRRLFLVFGVFATLLAGLSRRKQFPTARGRVRVAFATVPLLLFAALLGGCTNTPHAKTTATITIVGTGPNNQMVTVPITVTIKK
ncbi:MAG TPA: Ig-like domain repeat protein [Candidatus Acidoferrales bacterium]|nr:Ig-like domain repeat protein [Candidatus Acidoferrales bacterium]